MISRILVAVDGSKYSQKAFEYALYLAGKCRCVLIIVNVIEEFVTVGHSISKELKHQAQEMLQQYESRNTIGQVKNVGTTTQKVCK